MADAFGTMHLSNDGTWYRWFLDTGTGSGTQLVSNSMTSWTFWNNTTTSATTTAWPIWIADSASSISSLTIGQTRRAVPRKELTAEQLREAEVAQRKWAEAEKKRKAERQAAQARAWTLLLESLSEEQRAEFEADRRFHVLSSKGRLYEIREGRQHNVYELDEERRRRREFCITYPSTIPDGDVMLSQKLMLEAHEEELHRIANARNIVGAVA